MNLIWFKKILRTKTNILCLPIWKYIPIAIESMIIERNLNNINYNNSEYSNIYIEKHTSSTWITLPRWIIAQRPRAKIVTWLSIYDFGNQSAISTLMKECILDLLTEIQ
jgi:hypothetical protein